MLMIDISVRMAASGSKAQPACVGGHRAAGEHGLPFSTGSSGESGGDGPLVPSVRSAPSCDLISVQILGFNGF